MLCYAIPQSLNCFCSVACNQLLKNNTGLSILPTLDKGWECSLNKLGTYLPINANTGLEVNFYVQLQSFATKIFCH